MNAMVPTLSIIIPAYNEAESLPELTREIREVCEREKIDFEAIVIDDGSKDGTCPRASPGPAANTSSPWTPICRTIPTRSRP
jgi:GT2 family glycosyltransferase